MAHRCRSNSHDGPSMSFQSGFGACGSETGGTCGAGEDSGASEADFGATRVIMIIFSWRHCALTAPMWDRCRFRRVPCDSAAVAAASDQAAGFGGRVVSGGPEGWHPCGGGPEAVVSGAPEAAGASAAEWSAGHRRRVPWRRAPKRWVARRRVPWRRGRRRWGAWLRLAPAGGGSVRLVGWGWLACGVAGSPGAAALTGGRGARFCCFVGGGVRIGEGESHQSHKIILRYLFYVVLLSYSHRVLLAATSASATGTLATWA
jgi:hypothetical protein